MKTHGALFLSLSLLAGASAHADIVKCSATLADQPQGMVVFIQRDGSTGQLSSRPSDEVVLVKTTQPGQQAITLGHFKTEGDASEVGYDVDEGIRLFVSKAVERDQDKTTRIVMGREIKKLDDLHIFWPEHSTFQTDSQFYTQIRADVKKAAREYDVSLKSADDAPLSLGRRNVEPTSYSLSCSKVDASQFSASDKLDAKGNFINLEDLHDWSLAHAN